LTLMFVIPVVAIPVGWLVREIDLARKQREAMESTVLNRMLDPKSRDPREKSPQRQALRLDYDALEDRLSPWLGENFFRDPKTFVVSSPEFLPLIPTMTRLETILCHFDQKATGTEIDLADLRNLYHLEQLNVKDCRIVGKGLEPLRSL